MLHVVYADVFAKQAHDELIDRLERQEMIDLAKALNPDRRRSSIVHRVMAFMSLERLERSGSVRNEVAQPATAIGR